MSTGDTMTTPVAVSDVDVMKRVLAEKRALKPIKKKRILQVILKDHEDRLDRIERLLGQLAKEALAEKEQTGLIVAPTTKQTVAVAATKEG